MKYVEIPLNVAQRAARAYRPLLPYVRKFIAEQRTVEPIAVPDLGDFVRKGYDELRNELESKSLKELKKLGPGSTKKEIIDNLLLEEKK